MILYAPYLEDDPSASPAAVGNAITSNATPGVLSSIGTGSPNLLLYTLFSGGSSPDPDPQPGCDFAESESGSLSDAGAYAYHPGSSGTYYSGAGTHTACLTGPGR